MKIGIIGAGNIGSNAARLFVNAGNEVIISNSRGPETLDDLVEHLGDNASAGTVEQARDFGDVVFISIPLGRYTELPVEGWENKIVIDSNNYYPERDGQIAELDEGKTTSSEMLEKHLPGARIVKGFNTIWFEHLKTQGDTKLPLEERRAIFIAGDDSGAKEAVAKLIEEVGFAAVDTGFLHDGGKSQQPGTPIYNKALTAKEAAQMLESSDQRATAKAK
ncbi:MAG TPA: NAD(P)-binding domain-containing protein [Pyrinomonadaceae bacterium]|nr:NAD(P)-binding domain-containing protein [Pyrinomonadaceae bacterium]